MGTCSDHVTPLVHEITPLDNVPVRPNMKTLLPLTMPLAGLQYWVVPVARTVAALCIIVTVPRSES